MIITESLGNRMKHNYELPFQYRLPHRMPVVIRLDGRAFHGLAKKQNWNKPFDTNLINILADSTKELCEEIQNAKIAYLQSDEISILLVDYEKLETEPWFNYEIQKLASVTAGIMSAKVSLKFGYEATFDSRVFVLPPYEVCNYFIWRQQDFKRNSLQMVAREYCTQTELHKLDKDAIHEKLYKEHSFNWSYLPIIFRRGQCIIKKRNKWFIDRTIPIFTQDRDYIEKYIPELRRE